MKNKKGFTLVELLAVIVILAVLLLVAVPAISNLIASTRFSADRSEAQELIKQYDNCKLINDSCGLDQMKPYLKTKTEEGYGLTAFTVTPVEDQDYGTISFTYKGTNDFIFSVSGCRDDQTNQIVEKLKALSYNSNQENQTYPVTCS